MSSEIITPGMKPKLNVETTVSSYDKLNAILQAMLLMLGVIVVMMFIVWITSHWKWAPRVPNADITEALLEGEEGEKAPEGVGEDFFEPGVEEFPDVETPQLMDALEAVTNAVSTVRANSAFVDGDAPAMGKGRGLGHKRGGGDGGSGIIPEHKRWRIEYEAPDLDSYARQLSAFNIDIGAVAKDNNDVVRIRDPGAAREVIRTTRANETKSLYFGHQKPKLRQWDERILKKVGVPVEGNMIVQFYPESTRVILRRLEKERYEKNQRTLKQVKNTIFKLQPNGSGFEFVVIDQIYR